jgi:hypoxanthine phosphoribosyltransferase
MLLIDDVMTTGATLYEAARTLQKVRSGPVRGLVLARVLQYNITSFFKIIGNAAKHPSWPRQMRQKWQKLKSTPQWPVRFARAR